MLKKSLIFTAITSSLVLTACNDPKAANAENFAKALDAYLATQPAVCLRLPSNEVTLKEDALLNNDNTIILVKQDEMKSKSYAELEYLKTAGLAEMREDQIEVNNFLGKPSQVDVLIYSLTEKAKANLQIKDKGFGTSRKLCAGQTVLDKVGTFTEPAERGGMKVSRVNFSVKLQALPEWASKAELEQIFAGFDLTKQETEQKAVLILTSEGWQSEKLMRQ